MIPCFNEAARLSRCEVLELLERLPDLEILLVDDGSTDGTRDLILSMAFSHPRLSTMVLGKNAGKAEAVRKGLLQLSRGGGEWIGYADADFATPAREIARLLEEARHSRMQVILGSRIRRLGADIHRNGVRHYLGRVFATFSSWALQIPVYDTQCGAKLFRVTEALQMAIAEPFRTRWIFDIELMGRLLTGTPGLSEEDFLEVPLIHWREVRGSKFLGAPMIYSWLDLARVLLDLARRRRASRKRQLCR